MISKSNSDEEENDFFDDYFENYQNCIDLMNLIAKKELTKALTVAVVVFLIVVIIIYLNYF